MNDYDREADIQAAWTMASLLRRALADAGAGRRDASVECATLEILNNAAIELEDRLTAVFRSAP